MLWAVKPDGTVLQLDGPGASYVTKTQGLWDYPQVEPKLSAGYQSGAVGRGWNRLPRQFSMRTHLKPGHDVFPVRNADHNAARDALIAFFAPEETIWIRGEYALPAGNPGAIGYWEIEAIVGIMTWEEGTANYAIPLLAPDPTLRHTVQASTTQTLPNGGSSERTFQVNVAGNVSCRPLVRITPSASKTQGWRYRRTYTVTNQSEKFLQGYPVALPFDFGWHSSNGRIMPAPNLGRDIRVIANGLMVDRFFSNTGGGAAGKIWIYLDLAELATVSVDVIYGYMSAPAWQNLGNRGPIFDVEQSTNTLWVYHGAFKNPAGANAPYTHQWNLHTATAQGFAPINRRLPSPWIQGLFGVNAAGGEIPLNVQVQGYAGLAVHHPIGIERVVHSGRTQVNPALVKFVMRAREGDTGAITDEWESTANTSGALAAYGPVTTPTAGPWATPKEAIVFALRSLSVHQGVQGWIGGADHVELQLPSTLTPALTGASSGTTNETEIYMLEFTLENQTTGDEIRLFGEITKTAGNWDYALADFEEQEITMAGQPFYYALELVPPIRGEWFHLRPGLNTLRIRDERVNIEGGGLSVYIEWQGRRV